MTKTYVNFYWLDDIDSCEKYVRAHPEEAQHLLEAEYHRKPQPRYSLIQWLKRHRPHNPTVRTIHTTGGIK